MLPEWIYGALDFNLIESAIERGSVMIKGTSYEDNMKTLGVYIDEASEGDRPEDYPSTINIYARNFDAKKEISRLIREYNASVGKAQQITYTDYVGLLMDSVTTIVAYTKDVLIAFVAISLVVSSIMIGIITYISVLERTKEIGILRAIGASRRDISRVFNAETLIIGFGAGAIGIGVTLLLVLIMNLYLNHLTGIANLASLPTGAAFALVGISMLLTLIAGIIPSRIAAQKDPVVALRTE
jgi:putative ABC transport system permease protein